MPRYVDLDMLPQLEAWGCCCEGEDYAFVPVADVIQALRQAEAQTGEVAPVVHAKWIPLDGGAGAKCANCGEYYDSSGACDLMEGFRLFAQFYCYCPHCGAKMNEEEEKNV